MSEKTADQMGIYLYISQLGKTLFSKRNGFDLHLNIPITYMDAVLGAEIKVPTLTELADYKNTIRDCRRNDF